jgi:hypothetical protein
MFYAADQFAPTRRHSPELHVTIVRSRKDSGNVLCRFLRVGLGMTVLTSYAQVAVSSEIDRLVADDFELRFANNIGVQVSVRLACTMAQRKKPDRS